ncbi:MAG: cell division topological specificity factor MinE [Gammaproteobacteria bacterium]|jgi:cell division topological specificity factor
MSIFDFFLNNRRTAQKAKERLQILVSHQRTKNGNLDFIPQLRQELINVISKYVSIDNDQIQVELQQNENCSILELNITLNSPELVGS